MLVHLFTELATERIPINDFSAFTWKLILMRAFFSLNFPLLKISPLKLSIHFWFRSGGAGTRPPARYFIPRNVFPRYNPLVTRMCKESKTAFNSFFARCFLLQFFVLFFWLLLVLFAWKESNFNCFFFPASCSKKCLKSNVLVSCLARDGAWVMCS